MVLTERMWECEKGRACPTGKVTPVHHDALEGASRESRLRRSVRGFGCMLSINRNTQLPQLTLLPTLSADTCTSGSWQGPEVILIEK